jgi:hypothetical protein
MLYFALGYGQSELKMQEFNSKDHCEAAIHWLSQEKIEYKTATCLPK